MRYYCRPTATGGFYFMRTLGVGRAEYLDDNGQWIRDDVLWSEEYCKGNWYPVTDAQQPMLDAQLAAAASVA